MKGGGARGKGVAERVLSTGLGVARRRRGFSMIELAIVVVIVGVLAGIAVVRLSGLAERSRYTHVIAFVRDVQTRIEVEYQSNGAYPESVDLRSWFGNADVVRAPFKGYGRGSVFVSTAGLLHPARKTLSPGEQPYWYNNANGAFRVRVPAQKDAAASLALYNKLNSCDEKGGAPGAPAMGAAVDER